jgi:RNA polymerase sigma-32 factor
METRLSGSDLTLDPLGDNEEDDYSPISYLQSANLEPSAVLEQKQMGLAQKEGLATALANLDDRSRAIIEARWLNGDDQSTLHELAAQYGVSAERIRQIEAQAMKKMKVAMTQ